MVHPLTTARSEVELQVGLAARSTSLLTPAQIDRLEAIAFIRPMGVSEGEDALFDARRDLLLELCRPSATAWDLRVLRQAWDGCQRYYRIGIDAVRDIVMSSIRSS